MRLLITGIRGFVGRHLAQRGSTLGWEIQGTSRLPAPPIPLFNGQQAKLGSWAPESCFGPDLILKEFQPDAVVHLAAESFAGANGLGSDSLWKANFDGTRALLDSVLHHAPKTLVVFGGTGLVYGAPLFAGAKSKESDPLCPPNAYAASKSCADLLCQLAFSNAGLRVIRARPFNHIGPGQSEKFAVSSFARQFAAMKRGLMEPILRTGNLGSFRDFTDVRDIVRGYTDLIQNGEPGEAYNMGSGVATSMDTVVNHLCEMSGLRPEIIADPSLFRRSDPLVLLADSEKIQSRTGWVPKYDMVSTIRDLWTDWMTRSETELITPLTINR